MIGQTIAHTSRTSRTSLRTTIPLVARRTMVTQEEQWTLQTARNATSYIDGPNKVQLPHILPNIEASWKTLSKEEQYGVFRQLEELQRKSWNQLSLDEKKAAYFVSFGPHGPRKPLAAPGQGAKTIAGVLSLLGVSTGIFYLMRANGGTPVKTMTKEWQEASNELALEQKQNPITGVASENYKGKGHIQSA